MKIGVLAVQGDFAAHQTRLERLGAETVFVKTRAELAGLDGLILPGGESTTHLKFLLEEGLFDPIREMGLRGRAMLGTCAGAILLARQVKNPSQPSLGLVDMVIERNAYGRQVASEIRSAPSSLRSEPLEMVYIRAPIIEEVGPGVEVLARCEGTPVLVRQGKILAATFHPELTSDPTVHQLFLKLAAEPPAGEREKRGNGFQAAETSSGNPRAPQAAASAGQAWSRRQRVLFVCVGNSCRSQIAEALTRHLASDVIEPMSAGLSPLGEIAEPTRRVLVERQVSFDGQYSKGLGECDWRAADLIVNMTGIPGDALFGKSCRVLQWEIEDPFGEDLGVYRRVADEIEEKVGELANYLRGDRARKKAGKAKKRK